ncbi:MAG: PilZ domain-containing protein [Candidatus Aminicenantes bacterium]|nr:PilZ domain-containing protein [Candidatus Aminicenantes bacterium]
MSEMMPRRADTEKTPSVERRKERRVKEENRVIIEVGHPGNPDEAVAANAFTRDLSLSGARIWTDRLYPLNSKLNLTLYLSRSRKVIRVCATVQWMKSCDDGLYEMGVQFQPGVTEALVALLNHLYNKDMGIPTIIAG